MRKRRKPLGVVVGIEQVLVPHLHADHEGKVVRQVAVLRAQGRQRLGARARVGLREARRRSAARLHVHEAGGVAHGSHLGRDEPAAHLGRHRVAQRLHRVHLPFAVRYRPRARRFSVWIDPRDIPRNRQEARGAHEVGRIRHREEPRMEHVAQAVVGTCEISLARQERGIFAGEAVEHVDEHAVHAERFHLGGDPLHVQGRGFLHKRPVVEAVLVVVVPQPEVRRAGERCDVRILLRLLRESPHAPLRLPPGAVLPRRLSNRAREEEAHFSVAAPLAAVGSPPRDACRIRRIGAADDFAAQRVLHAGHRPHPGAGNAEEPH